MSTGAKRALLVGLNEFKNVSPLRGCWNDVYNFRGMLIDWFGLRLHDMIFLMDKMATKQNIVDQLKTLVSGSARGDQLWYFHSGHGSYVPDTSGDEADGRDEVLCPYDYSRKDPSTWLLDDELGEIFKGVNAGAVLECVIDACHSGTIDKGMQPNIRPKGIDAPDLVDRTTKRRIRRAPREAQGSYFVWAGCQDDQTSADAWFADTMRFEGAFTHHLVRQITSNPKGSRDSQLRAVRASLKGAGFSQIPQLEMGP